MIGFKLPRLFYGHVQRQTVIGQRADFCEFCVCVCRHEVVSFQSAPTLLFYRFKFEEFKRESRCEICQAQFPLGFQSRFSKPASDSSIGELASETNPGIVDRAILETKQMIDRSNDMNLVSRNRVVNFLRSHESEVHLWMRKWVPLLAVGSIQSLIAGFVLGLFMKAWLAFVVAGCGFVLAALFSLWFLRNRLFHRFDGRISRLLALTGQSLDELESEIIDSATRFPQATLIFRHQMETLRLDSNPLAGFERQRDFVPVLELATSGSLTSG